ncbi:MAG: omega-6 fatty acid desaturase (delta-12 desaturase) [Verrucomicrobiales bacterium]|jgi:omega-6 fatty acid desaturase (delta-12 desaturase)
MSDLPQSEAKITHAEKVSRWKSTVEAYQKPSWARATWQIVNTICAYAASWVGMYFLAQISLWLAIPLAVINGGLLVRIFIIFHDCGHGSFFKSRRANNILGFITGLLTNTPYEHWRWEHSVHHASSGHLGRRGTGDIWTLTVEEYIASSRWKKFAYRLARNPIVLFLIAPMFLFIVLERFPKRKANARAKRSVWIMNVAILALALALISIFGFLPWLVIQFTVLAVAYTSGVWLFYVQHQFEDTYWADANDWDFTDAALEGSSFYKLPKILQWFSGNIGFHHIHHLSPRIPNYNLERCHRSDPMLQQVKPLTLLRSFKSINFRLWDEKGKKLISFRELRGQRRAKEAEAA